MKKIKQENIHELANDLLNTVGREIFNMGNVYYKDGYVKLSIKPLSNELYLTPDELKEWFVLAEDAVKLRKRTLFKEHLLEFAKYKYEKEQHDIYLKLKTIYDKVRDNSDELTKLFYYINKTRTHKALLPTTDSQKLAFKKLTDSIEPLNFKAKQYVDYRKDISTMKTNMFTIDLNTDLTTADHTTLLGIGKSILISELEYLIRNYKRDGVNIEENFLRFNDIYDRFMLQYKDIYQRMFLVNSFLTEYEKDCTVGDDSDVVKQLKELGYLPYVIMINDHKISELSIGSSPEVRLPNIDLKVNRDGSHFVVQTLAVGALPINELKNYITGYDKAMKAVELLESLESFYYVKS